MKIGNKEFDTAKHTYIMGILNVTPDSFSDGGKWNGYDAAMRHAEELLEGGTDILERIRCHIQDSHNISMFCCIKFFLSYSHFGSSFSTR